MLKEILLFNLLGVYISQGPAKDLPGTDASWILQLRFG